MARFILFFTLVVFVLFFIAKITAEEEKPPARDKEAEAEAEAEEEEEKVAPYLVNLVIVVMNENHDAHIQRALKLKGEVMRAPDAVRKQLRVVPLYPDLFKRVKFGGWTILPLAKTLISDFQNANWFYFINEFATINAEKLLQELLKYDAPAKALFLGRAIQDSRPAIIHRYQFADGLQGAGLDYPDESAGFLLSRHLLARLIDNGDGSMRLPQASNDDIFFELAKLIRDKFMYRVLLKHVPSLCGAAGKSASDPNDCAVENYWEYYMDSKVLDDKEICYAVKTYAGNHRTRLKVLRSTWITPQLKSQVKFYSDVADDEAGTIAVPSTIPNVERGHCQKTLHILQDFKDHDSKKCKWLVLVDDDTLINTNRMARVLNRYSEMKPLNEDDLGLKEKKPRIDVEPLAVGERHGYSHWPVTENDANNAYDYLAGGAGIAFSRTAIELLASECFCALRDPDDMIISYCMKRHNLKLIHNPLFHSAAPTEYPWDLIRYQKPVSFHSFNDIDGKKAYDYFLATDTPRKYDGAPGKTVPPLHVQQPTTTLPHGIFETPLVEPDGRIYDEPPIDREAEFIEAMHHEEL